MATQWSDTIQLRSAKPGDIPGICKLEQQVPSSWKEPFVSAEILHENGASLVALTSKNVVAGWCCARFLPPEAELLKISVLPGLHRRNIGSRLLLKIIEICGEKRCNKLFLEVRKQNTDAGAFYASFGFSIQAIRKNYYRQPQDDCLVLSLEVLSQAITRKPYR